MIEATEAEDLIEHLTAGRRAAMVTLVAAPGTTWDGTSPEIFNGTGDIVINGVKIGAAVDAAVMETIVRMHAPTHRAWWKFWSRK